jgi:predicted ATPase
LIFGLCRLEDLPPERSPLIRTLERNNLLLHLPLQRLTYDETARLTASLLPDRSSDSLFLHRLYQETEGNPFFIIEIVQAMRESGRPTSLLREGTGQSMPPGGALSLPVSIQRVIEARLDHLADASRELLGIAAAIGHAFTFSLLAEISQLPGEQVIHCIEEWMQRGWCGGCRAMISATTRSAR